MKWLINEVEMIRLISRRLLRIIPGACFILLCFASAESQEIEYLGSVLVSERFRSVYVEDPYAYCNMPGGFKILDVTDPDAIIHLGECSVIKPFGFLKVFGNYAYTTGRISNVTSFAIIDISDSEDPIIASTMNSVAIGPITIFDGYAYIIDGYESFDIIDIADPLAPALAGAYENDYRIYSISVSGSYAYLAADSGGMEILDIANPIEPAFVNRYLSPMENYTYDVNLSGSLAYITVGSRGSHSIVEILDISDPVNPVSLGNIEFVNLNIEDLFIQGNYIYSLSLANTMDSTYFVIVNAENPGNPYEEWRGNILGYDHIANNDLYISSDRAYLFGNGSLGLRIMDISDRSSPVLIGSYRNTHNDGRFAVIENYIYALINDGISLIDISDYERPRILRYFDLTDNPNGIDIDQEYAYIIGNDLKIFDISILESPVLVGEYQAPGNISGFDIEMDFAYLIVGADELQIIDIADLSNPTHVGCCNVSGAIDVVVLENKAYITRSIIEYGVSIFDVSDPEAPQLIGSCETPRFAKSISIVGDFAYVATGDGLEIIDIVNPYDPGSIASYNTPGSARHIYTDENFAYLSGIQFGLIIVDISNPYEPEFAASYYPDDNAISSFALGDFVFVGNSSSMIILGFNSEACVYAPGDCNHNGTPLELGDVIAMISMYRGTIDPYTCNCPPHGNEFAATADPNGNCIANELSDVVTEIAAYRGLGDVSGCPDCPGSGR